MPSQPADADPVSSFDYADLAEADQKWLRQAADELRLRLRRTVDEVVASGRVLAFARKRLGRGKWEPWLAAEAQVPTRSASRLISVHKVFKGIDGKVLRQFTPTALYTLAEPGVPQSIREYAVEQAGDGAEVTAALVNQWVSMQRESVQLTRREIATLAPKDEKIVEKVDADKVNAADNWIALAAMVSVDSTLHLSHIADLENGDRVVSGTLITEGRRKIAVGKTLEIVVLELAGEKRTKKCRGACGEVKSLDKFSKRSDSKDGRNHYCLICEAARVRNYERSKARPATASGTN